MPMYKHYPCASFTYVSKYEQTTPKECWFFLNDNLPICEEPLWIMLALLHITTYSMLEKLHKRGCCQIEFK